jgi:hypothetical protein
MGIPASVTAAVTVAVIESRGGPHSPESPSRTLPHGFGGVAQVRCGYVYGHRSPTRAIAASAAHLCGAAHSFVACLEGGGTTWVPAEESFCRKPSPALEKFRGSDCIENRRARRACSHG